MNEKIPIREKDLETGDLGKPVSLTKAFLKYDEKENTLSIYIIEDNEYPPKNLVLKEILNLDGYKKFDRPIFEGLWVENKSYEEIETED